jgi:hypothetical protein
MACTRSSETKKCPWIHGMETFFGQIVAFKHLRAFLHKEMFEELNTMVVCG